MAKTSSAPATKKDVSIIIEEIGRLYDANAQWKDEILGGIKEWKSDIIHEFYIVAEDMRHDAFGIQKDRIADHEHRITRLERRTGVKA